MDQRQMQALLSQLGGAGGAGGFQQGPPPLCEFRAGRMHYDGRMVTPDRAKGWIRITRDPLQPGMVTFAFLDETKQNTIESLILFPDLAKFEKVKQSSDRVYLLEVQPEPRRLFFWMQDADKENDADRCKKCHNALNGIAEAPAAGAQANGTAAAQAAPPSRMQESGFQTSSAAASQNQLFGGAAGAGGQAAQQQALMEQFFQQMQAQQQRAAAPGISSVITPDAIQKLLGTLTDEEKTALKEHLPESQNDEEGLRTNLLSPQLRQAMQSLTQACETSEENVLMMMMMCDLGEGNEGLNGVEAVIRGFIRRYEDQQ